MRSADCFLPGIPCFKCKQIQTPKALSLPFQTTTCLACKLFSHVHDSLLYRSTNSIQSDLGNQQARNDSTFRSCQACHVNRLVGAHTQFQIYGLGVHAIIGALSTTTWPCASHHITNSMMNSPNAIALASPPLYTTTDALPTAWHPQLDKIGLDRLGACLARPLPRAPKLHGLSAVLSALSN